MTLGSCFDLEVTAHSAAEARVIALRSARGSYVRKVYLVRPFWAVVE